MKVFLENKIKTILKRYDINIDQDKIYKINLYFKELQRWGCKINLTGSIKDDFLLSLFEDVVSGFFVFKKGKKILELGAGSGILGVMLSLIYDIEIFLSEINIKKQGFLYSIKSLLSLKINILGDYKEIEDTFDIITYKAFKSYIDKDIFEILNEDGYLLLYKSLNYEKELDNLDNRYKIFDLKLNKKIIKVFK